MKRLVETLGAAGAALWMLAAQVAATTPHLAWQEPFKVPANASPQQKFKLALQAASAGNPSAQAFLGDCYRNGWGCTASPRLALQWYHRSATNGYERGQLKAAHLALDLGNFPEAQKWYLLCAKRGDVEAQFRLANLYDGVFKVPGRLALVKVHLVPNYRTADWHIDGTNGRPVRVYPVPVDYSEAAKWYRKAADQGHAAAQNNLGVMYALGHGVHADLMEAYKWFRIAARTAKADGSKDLHPMKQNLQELATHMTPRQLEDSRLRAAAKQ